MRGSRKFFQRGSNFDNVFLRLMRGEMIQIPLCAGHHRPGSETPFKWWPNIECWFGNFVVLQTIRTSIGKKLYFFKGGGVWTPYPPSGSAHAGLRLCCNKSLETVLLSRTCNFTMNSLESKMRNLIYNSDRIVICTVSSKYLQCSYPAGDRFLYHTI